MARRVPEQAADRKVRNRRWLFIGGIVVVLAFFLVGPGGLFSEIDNGRLAPDIVLTTVDGGEFRLHDLRGELVLLDFWASWCGPCEMSAPELDALYHDLAEGDPPLRVIGINQGEDAATARRAAAELGMTYPVVLDRDLTAGREYGADGIPLFVLIDTDRTILWKQTGYMPGIMDEVRRLVRSKREE